MPLRINNVPYSDAGTGNKSSTSSSNSGSKGVDYSFSDLFPASTIPSGIILGANTMTVPYANDYGANSKPIGSSSQPKVWYNEGTGMYQDTNGNTYDGNLSRTEAEALASQGSVAQSFNNVSVESPNEGLAALGQYIANAELASTNSANALSKYMWEQGEANTDRRLQQQMDFTHNEAQNAMAYQERMRNTAHQAEVADLIAAGLNPVLSANNGASTPAGLMGGASAVGANGFTAQKGNVVGAYSAAGEFISSLLNLKEQIRQFDVDNMAKVSLYKLLKDIAPGAF